jgi:hypothetical protein
MGERFPLGFLGTETLYRPSAAATGLGSPNASGVTKRSSDHTLDASASNASPSRSFARTSASRVDNATTDARKSTDPTNNVANTLPRVPPLPSAPPPDVDVDFDDTVDAKSALRSSSLDMSPRAVDARACVAHASHFGNDRIQWFHRNNTGYVVSVSTVRYNTNQV